MARPRPPNEHVTEPSPPSRAPAGEHGPQSLRGARGLPSSIFEWRTDSCRVPGRVRAATRSETPSLPSVRTLSCGPRELGIDRPPRRHPSPRWRPGKRSPGATFLVEVPRLTRRDAPDSVVRIRTSVVPPDQRGNHHVVTVGAAIARTGHRRNVNRSVAAQCRRQLRSVVGRGGIDTVRTVPVGGPWVTQQEPVPERPRHASRKGAIRDAGTAEIETFGRRRSEQRPLGFEGGRGCRLSVL